MSKLKFSLILFLFTVIFTTSSTIEVKSYEEPSCIESDGIIDVAASLLQGTDCTSSAEIYKITIKEVGLCKSVPAAPTTTIQFDNDLAGTGDNCRRIYYDPSGTGETVSVSATNAFSLNDNYMQDVSPGTYTYGYVIALNVFSVSVVKNFNAPITAPDTSSGLWCGTKNNIAKLSSNTDFVQGTICGTEEVVRLASGERQELVPNLCTLEPGQPCTDITGNEGATVGFYPTITIANINSTGRTFVAHLLNLSDGKLAPSLSSADRNLLMYTQLETPVTTTGNDTISLAFNKSGSALLTEVTGNYFFGVGAPEVIISSSPGSAF